MRVDSSPGRRRRNTLTLLVAASTVFGMGPAAASPPPERPLNLRTSDLYVSSLGIADGTSASSTGDGDGFAECGETVEITITFHSVSKTIVGAYVEVDPRGPAVHLIGGATAPLPSMSPGTTATASGTFVVGIDSTVTEHEWISFVVWVIPPTGEVFESHRHIPVECGTTAGSTTVSPPIVFPVVDHYTYSSAGWLLTARDLIHEGVDVFAVKMTPVVATANGVIASVNRANDPAHRGPILCCSLAVRHDSGWESWYSHLNNDTAGTDDGQGWGIAPGIEVGTRVVAGQLIGWVGDSGNAETTSPHLHIELHDPRGIPVNPYSYLQAAVSPADVPCTIGKMACRIAGDDRFTTAARLSAAVFPGGADTVFVATGRNFPDALAGAAVAARFGAPMLLVDTSDVPDVVAVELARLNPTTIIILGGTAAVSSLVELELADYGTVTRIGGPDRYSTAAAVSGFSFPGGAATALVAAGAGFADALAGGPAAAALDAPLLLVESNAIPDATADELRRLGPATIVLLGGTAAVSSGVATDLGAFGNVTRISGADRYDTAAAISAFGYPTGAAAGFVAVGTEYPDALAGSAAAGHLGIPLLVVPATSVPDTIAAEIARLDLTEMTILGGSAAVSISVQGWLSNMF